MMSATISTLKNGDTKSMILESNQCIMIFLLSSIALITLPHINHIPISLFAFFSFLLVWRFIGVWKKRYLPNASAVLLLTIVGILLLYSQHQGILGRDAGTSIFVIALGLKLLEIKTERDLYLICYLAFIVASSQFLYQQSMLMAVYILLVCCLLLATLISINSHKPETLPALKTAIIIVFQALPLSIVLFVFFPRLEAPRWMQFEQKNAAKSGLSDSLEPGSISRLGLSDELVFRVKFKSDLPPPNQRYWRGPVLSYTDGKRWTEAKVIATQHYLQKPVVKGMVYHYTLMMEPQNKKWVFALDMPTSFPSSLRHNALYQLINKADPNQRADFSMASYTHYNTGSITAKERKTNLQLPHKPSEKINQLVQQLHGFDQSSEYFIQSVLNHFTKEEFHYTLTPPLMENNPIETFLFDSRYGFCSHYATAFVYLMRVAGIPARVVTGYQGGEFNQMGGFLEIRQANAHAWTEVWLANKGWTRFDPTAAIAPERIEQDVNIDLQIATGAVNFSPLKIDAGHALSWMKKTRQVWNSIDYNWQRWVINYTQHNRAKFLANLGIDNVISMVYSLAACISIITLLLAWFILKNQRSKEDKELILYQLFCHKIAKIGLIKKPGETAQDFSNRIKTQRPELADRVYEITGVFIKIRYQQDSTKNDLLSLKKQVSNLKIQ